MDLKIRSAARLRFPAPLHMDVQVFREIPGHPPLSIEHLPDGTISVLLRITGRAGASMHEPHRGDVCVVGPRRRALFKTVRAPPLAIVVRFRPGDASRFLGVPASEITDRVVSLEDLWGSDGAHLRQTLLFQQGPREMLETLEAAFAKRARAGESASARLARRAVWLLERDAPMRVSDIAARLGVSERHLRRSFATTVGVSPKEFARMVRLQRALRASGTRMSWTQVAVDAGYYDQSHMIAEFSELVGASPRAFLSRDRAVGMVTDQMPCLAR